jgi:nucleoside-diphosphate-sugar epimerase
MAFTHLRAGEFMHADFRQVPSIVANGRLPLPMEDARIASIDVGDIAEVAATILTGSGHERASYPLTGPEALSMAEVAEKLSAAIGKRVEYVNVAPEEATRPGLPPACPRSPPTRWPSCSPSGGRAKRHRSHPSSRRSSLDRRPASTSSPSGTPRPFAASNRQRRSDMPLPGRPIATRS